MLDANLTQQLKAYLVNIREPIELVASLGDDAKSQQMRELIDEIAVLSDKITTATGDDARRPSFLIRRTGTDIGVRFAGLPMGHEFTSLVLALLQVGGHPSKAAQDLLDQVRSLDGDYRFETYFSLSCANCPDVVQALNLMAVLNPRVTHTAIDGALFQDEVANRKVMAVPTVFLNGEVFGQGRMELEQIVAKLDTGASARAAASIAAKDAFDVLVVGGGATGCGAALDAATRGLRVGLVEREDFSSGTSSRSTKLIHGGVRYLEKAVFNLDYGQLKLVFHALKERKQVIENAPHLCHALPCMTPCFNWFEVVYYWFGLKFYDLVAGRRLLHLSRYYSVDESVELFPTLAKNGHDRSLRGTVVYYDGQMNDSRLNVGLACTAAVVGAAVLNYAEVVSLIKDESGERIIGARIRDTLSGKEFETFAKVVINAAGPFCDSVRKMANSDVVPMICPSSGVHIVLPDYYSPKGMGLIVPKTKDGRVVFMLPWLGRTVAGTTDSSTAITMLPEPHEDEIQFILDAISDYLNVQVRRSDVLSAWSGIRPLAMDPSAKNTESISRDHVVFEDYPGLITITGGKWTTYRRYGLPNCDYSLLVELIGSNWFDLFRFQHCQSCPFLFVQEK